MISILTKGVKIECGAINKLVQSDNAETLAGVALHARESDRVLRESVAFAPAFRRLLFSVPFQHPLPNSIHRPDSVLDSELRMKNVQATAKAIIKNVEQVIVGKRQQVVYSLVSWFCEGHILLEDVPGVAKTMLARSLAMSVGCDFKRVQCTPDLLPSDVTGASIFNQKTTEFEFRKGPLFANLVLADEINRTTPRTQASLLEAMAEGCVTVDGTTYELEKPFLLIATQNPVDHEGTFPLPEAQLDRFLMKFELGYPEMADELAMLGKLQLQHPIETLKPVVTNEQILAAQKEVRSVHVDPKVQQYILQLVTQTRENEHLSLGGSPRASIALFRASQALAAMRGRNYVTPDDVKAIAPPVMTHRIILKPESRLRRITAAHVVGQIMDMIAVPVLENQAS